MRFKCSVNLSLEEGQRGLVADGVKQLASISAVDYEPLGFRRRHELLEPPSEQGDLFLGFDDVPPSGGEVTFGWL